MMNTEDIQKLIREVDASTVQELEFINQEYSIRISKHDSPRPLAAAPVAAPAQPHTVAAPVVEAPAAAPVAESAQPAPAQPAAEVVSNGTMVHSPIVGVAYLAPAPDKPVYKKVGDSVKEGETLCIVEAMKLMNEIPAPVAGKIGRILVEDGEVVEYDQPLFEII